MGLIINQGAQSTANDKDFDIINAKNVMMKVSKITLATKRTGALNVEFTMVSGPSKGRKVWDLVDYSPTAGPDGQGKLAWKYRALRKAAGCEYREGEPKSIDIEALLVNKAVLADLELNVYTNSEGKRKEGQAIKYQNPTSLQAMAAMQEAADAVQDEPEAIMPDDELPFNQGSSAEGNEPAGETSDDDPLKGW